MLADEVEGLLGRFEVLHAGSACDNVLLEHTLALEWFERGEIKGIFPVMVGNRGAADVQPMSNRGATAEQPRSCAKSNRGTIDV